MATHRRQRRVVHQLRTAVAHRNLLYLLSLKELRTRYRKSVLGWAWSLLNPLSQMVIFTVVFLYIFQRQPPVGDPSGLKIFPLYFLAGLLPFQFFSISVSASIGSVQEGASLIKKVAFPHEHLVLSIVVAQFATLLIELAVLSVAFLIFGHMVLPWLVPWLMLMVLVTMFTIGVGSGGFQTLGNAVIAHECDPIYLGRVLSLTPPLCIDGDALLVDLDAIAVVAVDEPSHRGFLIEFKATLGEDGDRVLAHDLDSFDSVAEIQDRFGAEALDLLKAWNTGNPGGCATVHANSAGEALTRLDQLAQEAGVPSQTRLIASTVHLVVHMERRGSSRRIRKIVSVQGVSPAGEFLVEPIVQSPAKKETEH